MGIRFFVPLPGPFYYTPGRKRPRGGGVLNSPAPELADALKTRQEAKLAQKREEGHSVAHHIGIDDPDTVNEFIRYYVHDQSVRKSLTVVSAIATFVLVFAMFPLAFVTLAAMIYLLTPHARALFVKSALRQQHEQRRIFYSPHVAVCACDQIGT